MPPRKPLACRRALSRRRTAPCCKLCKRGLVRRKTMPSPRKRWLPASARSGKPPTPCMTPQPVLPSRNKSVLPSVIKPIRPASNTYWSAPPYKRASSRQASDRTLTATCCKPYKRASASRKVTPRPRKCWQQPSVRNGKSRRACKTVPRAVLWRHKLLPPSATKPMWPMSKRY